MSKKTYISSDPLSELLHFVGNKGLATVDQCECFLLRDFSKEMTKETILFLVRNRYLWEASGLSLKQHSKIILYLTHTGHDRLRKISRDMARFSVSGSPNKNKNRVNNAARDLLIQESVLDWRKEYDVIWFITERQLERDENLFRWRELKESINPKLSDDFTGDYKIVVRNRQTKAVEIYECAIAVKQKISFIRRQPDRLKWFVCSSATAGKINLYTAQNAKILDPLSGDRGAEITESVRVILENDKIRTPSSTLNQTDRSILEALEKTGMALSLNDLAALICTDPEPFETCLDSLRNSRTKLLKLGLVMGKEGKTRPGYGDGRPAQYVFLPESVGFFYEKGFQRYIILAFFLRHELKKGRNFSGFNSKTPALTMEFQGERITYLSDYADGEHDDFVAATVEDYKSFRVGHPYLTKLIVVDYSRQDKLLKHLRPENLQDLCALFDEFV